MDLAEITSGNLLRVTPSFRFHVVTADPDDNIFSDCAITAGAEFLITEDSHFALGATPVTDLRPSRCSNGFVQSLVLRVLKFKFLRFCWGRLRLRF